MKKIILRETVIYAAMLLVLALLMHPDLFSDPATRVALLSERGSYLHPLIYASLLYALTGLFRLTIRLFRRFVRNRNTTGQ
jgi:hypothetical protein